MTSDPRFSHKPLAPSRVKKRAGISSDQGDLFQRLHDEPEPDADLDVQFELLGAIKACLRSARNRGLSREDIVKSMNDHLPELARDGEKAIITKRQLDGWTASSKEYSEFPARFLPAFCVAVESMLPLLILARSVGRDLVDAREAKALRLGELKVARARNQREERALTRELGGE